MIKLSTFQYHSSNKFYLLHGRVLGFEEERTLEYKSYLNILFEREIDESNYYISLGKRLTL